MANLSELIIPVKNPTTGEVTNQAFNLTSSGTDTIPSAYCITAGNEAAKVASCTNYECTENSYLHILIKNMNTAVGPLTLNVNNTGALPIYINGSASSNSNYRLPSGTYIVRFKDQKYHFRYDGYLPGTQRASVSGETVTFTDY